MGNALESQKPEFNECFALLAIVERSVTCPESPTIRPCDLLGLIAECIADLTLSENRSSAKWSVAEARCVPQTDGHGPVAAFGRSMDLTSSSEQAESPVT